MEMANTLQQLNIRINKFVPYRIRHITRILYRFFQTEFSPEQIQVCLENWELILPMYNDCIGGKTFEQMENEIKSYCSTQYEHCSVSLLNCFIPLLTQCINPNCSRNDLSNPVPHHDVTIFCSGEGIKK